MKLMLKVRHDFKQYDNTSKRKINEVNLSKL